MTCLDKFRHEFLDIISLEDENMEKRDTTLLLQVTETEKEFLLRCAEDTCLSLSDFVLLAALSVTPAARKQKVNIDSGDLHGICK